MDDGASVIRELLHHPCKLGGIVDLRFLQRPDRDGHCPDFTSTYKWNFREIYQELSVVMSEVLDENDSTTL